MITVITVCSNLTDLCQSVDFSEKFRLNWSLGAKDRGCDFMIDSRVHTGDSYSFFIWNRKVKAEHQEKYYKQDQKCHWTFHDNKNLFLHQHKNLQGFRAGVSIHQSSVFSLFFHSSKFIFGLLSLWLIVKTVDKVRNKVRERGGNDSEGLQVGHLLWCQQLLS